MEVVPNLHRIHIHFVQQLSWQIVDVQHIVLYYNHPFLQTINVNERDAIIIQSIQLHHLNILMENVFQPMVHLLVLFAMVLGIMLVLNLFVAVEIIPIHNGKEIRSKLIYIRSVNGN